MTDRIGPLMMIVLITLPLLAAAACFIMPRAARTIGLATSVLLWIPLIGLVRHLHHAGTVEHQSGGWAPPLGITLQADGLSIFLLVMVGIVATTISLAVGLAGALQPEDRRTHARFWGLWLILWSGLHALLLSRDLFNLYVTLELIGLSAVALVTLADRPAAIAAAMRYLLVNLLGSLSFLAGVALVYAEHATLDLQLLTGQSAPLALALMTTGLLVKAALFPLHAWLPAAHGTAQAPISAALSALVIKAGFAVLLRLWLQVFAGDIAPAALTMLGALGAAAILYGSVQALVQRRLKLVIAYSTVAQIGYLFLIFPIAGASIGGFGALAGGAYFALSHACAKTVMFLSAGNLARAAGHDRLADLRDTAHRHPISLFALGLAGVSIIGLPPSGGFLAKWILLNAAITNGQWWWVLIMAAGTLLAAAYMLRILRLAFLGTSPPESPRTIPAAAEWIPMTLALVTIALAFTAPPMIAWLRIGAPLSGPVLSGGLP